ncbi:hypothetical protein ACIOC1_32805 [Streptomyces sp. NPDC088197]|uniref:hypothetical protein n=1 Tax=Streptomyces sp. NPDC088197 TaxID=3365840 RepID=UPI00380A0272
MGDSFISGEAGRWQGNSTAVTGSRNGTDRAYRNGAYLPALVYGASYADHCNRSDSAEIDNAPFTDGAPERVNLACSGALARAVYAKADGGEWFKGEEPQADQLRAVAAGHRVRLIALSVGGNDIGFSDVILACAKEFLKPGSSHTCAAAQQKAVEGRFARMREEAGRAVDSIRAVMRQAGQQDGSYRLVLQSYPSPLPDAARNRYPARGYKRFTTGGCPFSDTDLDWAHDTLVPEMTAELAQVATARHTEFLDLSAAFQGREVCADQARQATAGEPPAPAASEWVRFLVTGLAQGERQESLHPDFYGQLALGRCLALAAGEQQSEGHFRCADTSGKGPEAMTLAQE